MDELKNTTDLFELLRGCRVMRDAHNRPVIQTIGAMQIAFLQTDDEFMDKSLTDPLGSIKVSNSNYGEITMKNDSASPVIVPAQMAFFQKNAQNHAMMKAAYLQKNALHTFNDASCVEGSQPGHLEMGRPTEFHMMPLLMRPYMFGQVGGGHFGKTYSTIERLNVLLDVPGGANYIDRYFTRYGEQMQKFIAHFERPDNIIGIIVLLNGEIVAIDKFPNTLYPACFWELLVRDCYASLAIAISKAGYGHPHIEVVDEDMKDSPNPAEYLEMSYNSMLENMGDKVIDAIRTLGQVAFKTKPDTDGGGDSTKSFILSADGWTGQVISKHIGSEDVNIYVSIVRDNLMKENTLASLSNAAKVRRVSSKQKPLQI